MTNREFEDAVAAMSALWSLAGAKRMHVTKYSLSGALFLPEL